LDDGQGKIGLELRHNTYAGNFVHKFLLPFEAVFAAGGPLATYYLSSHGHMPQNPNPDAITYAISTLIGLSLGYALGLITGYCI